MDIFIQVLLPVLLIFLAGFSVQKWRRLDIKSVSAVAIYILIPILVFQTFYKAELNQQYLFMVLFSLLLLAALIIIAKGYSRINRYEPSVESGLILSTAFMNAGNYGAPIVLFAYGQAGFAYSVSFLVLQSIIMNFFGIYYAARGKAGVGYAIRSVLAMPPTYATIVALVMNVYDINVPANVMSAVDLVAGATIPIVMLVLGMQLAEIRVTGIEWPKVSFGVITRLVASPLIAFVILLVIPVDPLMQKVLILSAAMPSAATTTMYALQFDSEPDLVSGITMITTLLSIFTITALIIILG